MHRMVEIKESLRAVEQEYGVSHEMIHRIMFHNQQECGQQKLRCAVTLPKQA